MTRKKFPFSRPSVRLALLLVVLLFPALPLGMAQTPARANPDAPSSPQDEAVSPQIKAAVDRALVYLKAQQRPDGSFPAGGSAGTTAVPSLVAMAFMAHGEVPGQGPYGEVVNKAIDYVLDSQTPDGLLSRNPPGNVMYEHGISTVMLAEAYGMVDDARRARIDTALAKSVAVILAAQKVPKQGAYPGGWRYQPTSPDSDISCTGWQLMALRGAASCGAPVPPDAIAKGRVFIQRCSAPTGGFCYIPGQTPNQARSGTGIVAMELLGKHNTPEALAAGDFLLTHLPDAPNGVEFYYYAVYYDAQAANQLGGKYWSGIYPPLCKGLLSVQQSDGNFTGGGASQEQDAGPCYRTAMACLALCVPYRYLPLYQK